MSSKFPASPDTDGDNIDAENVSERVVGDNCCCEGENTTIALLGLIAAGGEYMAAGGERDKEGGEKGCAGDIWVPLGVTGMLILKDGVVGER
jgi:hypothetical protein